MLNVNSLDGYTIYIPEGFYPTLHKNIYANKDGQIGYFSDTKGFTIKKTTDSYYNNQKGMRISIKGAQYLAARLVLEAFEKNLTANISVSYKDGDYHNIQFDNLCWMPSNNHASETMIKSLNKMFPYTCSVCGRRTKNQSLFCGRCYDKSSESLEKKKIKKEKRTALKKELIQDELKNINLDFLTRKTKEFVISRREGMSYEAIGKKYGCSRQYVQRSIAQAKKRKKPTVCKENQIELISEKYDIPKDVENDLLSLIFEYTGEKDSIIYRKCAEIYSTFPISAKGAFNSARRQLRI